MKILITDPISTTGMQILKNANFTILDYQKKNIDLGILPEIDGWIIRSGTEVNQNYLKKAKKLQVIGRAGVGVDNIDVSEATKAGVIVMNTPDSNTISAAEHSFALIAALSKNIHSGHLNLINGSWSRHNLVGIELRGKTLGIVGLGRIGRELIKRAQSFEMKILGYDPYISQDMFNPSEIKVVDLDTLTMNSDFISLHVPMLDSTRNLFDYHRISKMKSTARLINVARGGIINEKDLVKALDEDVIAGAAIDVFESEPIKKNHPLISAKNILLTPHLGASTKEAKEGVSTTICEQVVDYLINNKINNALNMPLTNVDDLKKLEPYINLANKIGQLHSQLAKGAITNIQFECYGTLEDSKPLILSFLKGLLENYIGSRVNFINAFSIAEERGISIEHGYNNKETIHTNLIQSYTTSNAGKIKISGSALSGRHLRIVNLMGFDIDFRPEKYMLFLKNNDVPGVIGKVGTMLGDQKVNIAEYHLSRSNKSKYAYAIIKLDEEPTKSVIDSLNILNDVLEVKPLLLK